MTGQRPGRPGERAVPTWHSGGRSREAAPMRGAIHVSVDPVGATVAEGIRKHFHPAHEICCKSAVMGDHSLQSCLLGRHLWSWLFLLTDVRVSTPKHTSLTRAES